MRAELFADSKDVWKWSVAIRKAKEEGQCIQWIAMYRPDENMHGDDERNVPNAIPEVEEFFRGERAFIADGHPACLSRTTVICHQLGVEMFANLDHYPSSEPKRKVYLEAICKAISSRKTSKPYLVLLDPDDGIGQRQSNGKQFHKDHLRLVWNCLKEGDTMGIVQFKQHLRDGDVPNSWHLALQKVIAGIVGVSADKVVPHRWDIVCIYLVDRKA